MEREIAAIESDPMIPVSDGHARRAHARQHSATTGFESPADVAAALEKWLADAMELPPNSIPTASRTRSAVDAASDGESVRGAEPYPARCRCRAGGCARAARSAAGGEGTHIKLPGVLREAPTACDPPQHPRCGAQSLAAAPAVAASKRPDPRRPTSIACRRIAAMPIRPRPAQTRVAKPFEAGKDQRKMSDDVDRTCCRSSSTRPRRSSRR
jgi:hypothetical protein